MYFPPLVSASSQGYQGNYRSEFVQDWDFAQLIARRPQSCRPDLVKATPTQKPTALAATLQDSTLHGV
jgi:hypothetical protein